MTTTASDHVGRRIAGRYRIQEQIGRGGMSTVYRAFDEQLERTVAVKWLHAHFAGDEEFRARFTREARMAARLTHPHVVAVLDAGVEDDRPFIVLELVDGPNLKQRIRQRARDRDPLPVGDALRLAREIGEALAAAHAAGLVHRDVKPHNVLLAPTNGRSGSTEGQAKVTDFGIARIVDADQGLADLTATGTVIGSADYLSPEQALGTEIDGRADVYALGVVCFEMLAGRLPFHGEGFVQTAMLHVSEAPPELRELRPEVAPGVAALVARCLAKAPELRPQSMDAFLVDLAAAPLERRSAGATEPGGAPPATTLMGAVPWASSAGGDAGGGDATGRAAPVTAAAGVASRRSSNGGRWLALALLLLVAAAVVGVVLVAERAGGGASGSGTQATTTSGAPATPAPSPAAAPAATPEPVTVSLTVADPEGTGDGENDAQLPNAVDGDPSTYWPTSSYDYSLAQTKKAGVGFGITPTSGDKLTQGTVTVTGTPGATVELYGFADRASFDRATTVKGALAGSGAAPLATATTTAETKLTFDVTDGAPPTYLLVWFTELPKDANDGKFREQVDEVTLAGVPAG